MELFKIVGTIAVNNSDANNALDETAGKAEGSHGKITNAFKKIGNAALSAAKVVVAAMGTMTVAFGALATIAIKYNSDMEQYIASFATMLGSEEEALELVEKLKEKAASTPFEMEDLASATQLLMNYGFTADEASEKMLMLGDIAQGDAQKMERVATAYGQMSSAGKVSLEDIKQMIEAGFNPLQEISETTGESMESLYDRISKGTITVDEITASMERSTAEGGKYFGSMERQSQTLSGRLSTLKDTINSALGEAFAGVSEILSSDVIPKLTEMAQTYIPVLGAMLEKLLPPVMQAVEEALPMVVSLLDMIVPMLVEFAEKAGPMVGDVLSTVLPLILIAAQEILPKLYDMLSKVSESELFGESFANTLSALLDIFSSTFDFIYSIVSAVLALLEGDMYAWSENNVEAVKNFGEIIKNIFVVLWESVLKFFAVALENILLLLWGWVVSTGEKIKTKISEILETIKTTVKEKFTAIKDGIKEKITEAVQVVKDGIEKLKSFFDFEWSLPKLKMPHFNISGSFSLNPPSVPSFGVDWYAKGAVLNEPTAFGMNGNKLMVGGEAGPEAIAPIATLQKYVSEAVASQNAELVEVLYKILGAIHSVDGNMGENMREALAGTSLNLDRREFARLVKAVN
jgi:tape measure domain-containing protein